MFLIHVSGPQMSTEKHLFIAPSSIIGKSHHKVSKVIYVEGSRSYVVY